MMTSKYEHAELLAALWKLGSDVERRMPTSHGYLDRALENCKGELPRQLKDYLTFGVTAVGLRCFELPEILLAAQEAMLTSEPNPTYLSTIVTLNVDAARQIVLALGISTRTAREIGQTLHTAVQRVVSEHASAEADRPIAA